MDFLHFDQKNVIEITMKSNIFKYLAQFIERINPFMLIEIYTGFFGLFTEALPMKKILIVDDHPLFRESLSGMLTKLSPWAETPRIFLAENASQALNFIDEKVSFDLILSDIDMPGMDGLLLLQQLLVLQPDAHIVMISGSESRLDIQKALQLGAKGFIQKNSETSVMLAAIQLVLAGGTYIPPLILHPMQSNTAMSDTSPLTERQMEILAYLKEGMQNKRIAHTLDLSEATVKVHVRHIFSVLGVKNRTQAVQKAMHLGIL